MEKHNIDNVCKLDCSMANNYKCIPNFHYPFLCLTGWGWVIDKNFSIDGFIHVFFYYVYVSKPEEHLSRNSLSGSGGSGFNTFINHTEPMKLTLR